MALGRFASAAAAIATAQLAARCDAKVIAAAVLPHGDFAYDPGLIHGVNGSQAIHDASVKLGEELAALQPDVIFITVPHGISLTNDFAIYTGSIGSGFALVGGDLHNASFPSYPVFMNFSLAPSIASDLVTSLRSKGKNVTSLLPWGDSEPTPIRWSEVIPLTFLSSWVNQSSTGSSNNNNGPQVIILSQPQRRYNHTLDMIQELLRVGGEIFTYLDVLPQSVLMLSSADLAHTHANPVSPYGNSSAAEPFDAACGAWAETLIGTQLTVTAAEYVDDALSCGYTGMVLLHGAMCASPGGIGDWTPALLARAAPTYYGMMVARFLRGSGGAPTAGAAVR